MLSAASAACGLAQLEGRHSQACRCSRVRRPIGSDSELRDRPGVPPQRHPSEVGDPLTRTPLRRACRPQRPSSPLIAHAHRVPARGAHKVAPAATLHGACTGRRRLRHPPSRWRASFASAWRRASLSEAWRRASFSPAWRRASLSDAWRRASFTAARLCASPSETRRRASFSAAWPNELTGRAPASPLSAGIVDPRLSSLKIFGIAHPV